MELGAAAQTKKPTSVVLLTAPNVEEQAKLFAKYESLYAKISAINHFI